MSKSLVSNVARAAAKPAQILVQWAITGPLAREVETPKPTFATGREHMHEKMMALSSILIFRDA